MADDRLPSAMRAWEVHEPGPIANDPLRLVERPVPMPGQGEVLVRVRACGVCRTDLHLAEGDLAPRAPCVVPGHEAVGEVVATGAAVGVFAQGDRVGIAWLRHTCGQCRWCRSGAENVCPRSRYTGWDDDGGYAEYAVVPAAYAYRLPASLGDREAAPLLCAGIIGYRALQRTVLGAGERLGIYGFGASAHITAQLALAAGAELHVMTRGREARRLAIELGAASVTGAYDAPPVALDAAIIFAPVGDLVPVALEALDRRGRLVLAGIHVSEIPPLDYQRHLFHERSITSTTSNTRGDGDELFRLAAQLDLRITTTRYPFERADEALADLAAGRVRGGAVVELPFSGQ